MVATKGAQVAPMANPYRTLTACGMILESDYYLTRQVKRNSGTDVLAVYKARGRRGTLISLGWDQVDRVTEPTRRRLSAKVRTNSCRVSTEGVEDVPIAAVESTMAATPPPNYERAGGLAMSLKMG